MLIFRCEFVNFSCKILVYIKRIDPRPWYTIYIYIDPTLCGNDPQCTVNKYVVPEEKKTFFLWEKSPNFSDSWGENVYKCIQTLPWNIFSKKPSKGGFPRPPKKYIFKIFLILSFLTFFFNSNLMFFIKGIPKAHQN